MRVLVHYVRAVDATSRFGGRVAAISLFAAVAIALVGLLTRFGLDCLICTAVRHALLPSLFFLCAARFVLLERWQLRTLARRKGPMSKALQLAMLALVAVPSGLALAAVSVFHAATTWRTGDAPGSGVAAMIAIASLLFFLQAVAEIVTLIGIDPKRAG